MHPVVAAFKDIYDSNQAMKDFVDWPGDMKKGREKAPNLLPGLRLLPGFLEMAITSTEAFCAVLEREAKNLHWKQSYKEEQIGRDFLDQYAWCNLIAPDGVMESHQFRLSVAFFGANTFYPSHRHPPEELYFVLAGSACFCKDGAEDVILNPGDTYYIAGNQGHSMKMLETPILAMSIWKGDELPPVPTMD